MIDRDYKVKFITSKNNFVFLPDKDSRLLSQDLLIRLSYGLNKTAYFSLGPSLSSLKEGELAISSVLAKELGIFKNDTVSLSSTTYICSINKLNVITASSEDYEILALLANDIQDTLLNQVRIVHNKQKLVIWISNSLYVTVEVDGVLPISPGKLETLTEVVILPPEEKNPTPSVNYANPSTKKRGSFTAKESILNKYNKSQTVCRLHPISDIESEIDNCSENHYFEQPFNIFLSKTMLPAHFEECTNTVTTTVLVNLRNIPLPHEASNENNTTKNLIVRMFLLEELLPNYTNTLLPIVYANDCIFSHLQLIPASKIILEPLKDLIKLVNSIEISTTKEFYTKIDEIVKNYLLHHCQKGAFLMNSNVLLTDANKCQFKLKFDSDKIFCLVDRSFITTCKFLFQEEELIINKNEDKVDCDVKLCLDCCNYKSIVGDVLKYVDYGCNTEATNLMLVGKIGTGKTSLLKYISQTVSKKPNHTFVEFINCKKLKGKNIDSLQKVLNAAFLKLIYYQPSIVVLDDLHVICEKVVEGDVPSQENIHLNRVSELLADMLEAFLSTNCISIIATSESVMKLNQHIFSSRGKHLFKNVISINDLNKDDRVVIMKYLFELKEVDYSHVDFDGLGVKTEGFVMQDMIDYVDKIIFECYKECITLEHVRVTTANCEEALKNTSSLSLREVQLHTPGERDFNDVGGLEEVKKILVESMMWPAQYPHIFGRAPLRLQSGLLLYGPPGTGKTILAGAAAKHCNLRLISVKGPELLSKYIGASEQSVRDIFQKAQNAKPCILFFDEFDSLAPRRGHDNTGVTDRVVNQFLTQLDGVESLSGVCVLAATSRPDLLDPALLRPGRLDRQILCPIPDRDSRLAILRALSKSIPLAKDVSLDQLADGTSGYTGADLQAVLYTAQLSSVEHLLEANEFQGKVKNAFSSKGKIKPKVKAKNTSAVNPITKQHIETALKTTRPSLTIEEKLKYERIYSRFQGKGDVLDIHSGKQRTTLA